MVAGVGMVVLIRMQQAAVEQVALSMIALDVVELR
jgi:hypothetical protein